MVQDADQCQLVRGEVIYLWCHSADHEMACVEAVIVDPESVPQFVTSHDHKIRLRCRRINSAEFDVRLYGIPGARPLQDTVVVDPDIVPLNTMHPDWRNIVHDVEQVHPDVRV